PTLRPPVPLPPPAPPADLSSCPNNPRLRAPVPTATPAPPADLSSCPSNPRQRARDRRQRGVGATAQGERVAKRAATCERRADGCHAADTAIFADGCGQVLGDTVIGGVRHPAHHRGRQPLCPRPCHDR